MAVKLRASIVGTKELRRRLKAMNPGENRRILTVGLTKAALMIQVEAATKQIVHGRTKSPPLPDRLTNRSGGRGLVGSIAVNRRPLPNAIEVGTSLVYGAVHEEGRGSYPVRAFLAPALKKIGPKLGAIMADAWKREAARGA